ncbi:putative aldouronate transport system permease protein [Paenibacillus phyllosphaerae]|uniref:Putative aldouronate transport system permease protein n=1 Tax=Paenibacillus phyllosphaerae TaxID=274593 RepID=A0A7W5AZP8_9BACL|nr:carbohydrate ABC transporter permease [Paenibacillus phyllosphaerae]MBB3111617.1 putative aldouronate transport system permease protein [Paenibacillus phyllosphaerae]
MSRQHRTVSGTIFDAANYILLGIAAIAAIFPFLYVIAGSFASDAELTERSVFIIPETFTLGAYRFIFSTDTILKSIGVSVFVTVCGTLINLLFTCTMAYPLARRGLMGRNLMLNMIVVTMVFSGGLIPTYLVIRELGMLDSYWALMLPGAINAFNLIIIKNFFQELPMELEEAARIDGCTDIGILWKIVLPLSKPVLATFALFYAVSHWNDFFASLIYLNDPAKWPLQVMLRQIVLLSQAAAGDLASMDPNFVKPPEQSVKMAVIVVGTVPIMLVYPFLQKYFAKGVLIGSVKG